MKYYAFISYKHKDKSAWAKNDEIWAHKIYDYLTAWNIPSAIDPLKLIVESDKRIDPVFRDKEEIHGGNDVTKTLRKELDVSKTLVVVCSKKMIEDQLYKRSNNECAYIFDEIDYYYDTYCQENIDEEKRRTIIFVWIDKIPFDKNASYCLPPRFVGNDLKVIEANNYRQHIFSSIKRRTTSEIAASIFKTRRGAFWDNYRRQRRQRIAILTGILICLMIIFGSIITIIHRSNQMNKTYLDVLNANMNIDNGERSKASTLAKTAYSSYKNATGLSELIIQCADKRNARFRYDSNLSFCDNDSLYTVVINNNMVNVYDAANDKIVERIMVYDVENSLISRDNNFVACVSSKDSIRIFDRTQGRFVSTYPNNNKYRYLQFSNTGKYLYSNNSHHGAIYDILNGSQYPIIYLPRDIDNIDNITSNDLKGCFMDSDSLFFVYGNKDIETEYNESQIKNWSYYTYLLPSDRSSKIKLIKKTNVPPNTLLIKALPKQYLFIFITAKGIQVHDIKNDNTIINHFTYPETELNIVDVIISHNEKYAMLINDNNVRYIYNLLTGELTLSNRLLKNGKLKPNSDIAIGVTDGGYPIILSEESDMLVIPTSRFRLSHSMQLSTSFLSYNYKIPKNIRNRKTILGFYTKNTGLILKEAVIGNSSSTSSELEYNTISYIYERDLTEYIYDNSKTVHSISPNATYIVYKDNIKNLYYIESTISEIKINISEILDSSNSLIELYFSSDERFVIIENDNWNGEKWVPGYIIYDLKTKEINKKGSGYFSLIDQNQIRIGDNTNCKIYNLLTSKTTDNFSLRNISWKYGNYLLLDTIYDGRHKYSILDIDNNKINRIPEFIRDVKAISANGEYLVSTPSSDSLIIYGIKEDYNIKHITSNANIRIGTWPFFSFSKDNKYLIYEEYGELKVLDVEKGTIIWTLVGFFNIKKAQSRSSSGVPDLNTYFGFASSDKYIAVQSEDIHIIDIETGKSICKFNIAFTDRQQVNGWQFSPNGKYLIAGNYLINIEKGEIVESHLPKDPIYINDKYIVYKNYIYTLIDIEMHAINML